MRLNLPSETFLVDRHLNGDVRKLVVSVALGVGLDGCHRVSFVLCVRAKYSPEWNFEFLRQIPAGRSSWKTLLTTTMKKNLDPISKLSQRRGEKYLPMTERTEAE